MRLRRGAGESVVCSPALMILLVGTAWHSMAPSRRHFAQVFTDARLPPGLRLMLWGLGKRFGEGGANVISSRAFPAQRQRMKAFVRRWVGCRIAADLIQELRSCGGARSPCGGYFGSIFSAIVGIDHSVVAKTGNG